MQRSLVSRSSCALLPVVVACGAACGQSVTYNGVVYGPANTSTTVQTATFAGRTHIVARDTRSAPQPEVRATPLSPFVGFSSGLIPWMLTAAPPEGAYTQFHLDATTPGGTLVRSAIEITLGAVRGEHAIHLGSNLDPSALGPIQVEYRLSGRPVHVFVLPDCGVWQGWILPQTLCEQSVLTYCQLSQEVECYCVLNPDHCAGYEVGGSLVGRTLSGHARLGGPYVVVNAAGQPFTIDEIAMSATLATTTPQLTPAAFRFRGGGGVSNIALRDMEVIAPPPPPPCRADFNGDHAVTSQDFFDFLRAFFQGDPAADINGDRAITSQDFFDFIAAFFGGC